jgi:DNA-binding transcriptional regulator YiaG
MSVDQILMLSAARAHASDGTGRTIRQRAQVSMKEVATAIGSSEPVLSRWERGERMPRGVQAVRWAQLLARLDQVAEQNASLRRRKAA